MDEMKSMMKMMSFRPQIKNETGKEILYSYLLR